MYFGRRVTAFCAAVVVFTLETHDSSLGGQMAHHGAQSGCVGCQPQHTGTSQIAIPRARPLPYRVADAGWQSSHPTGSDGSHAGQPYGGPETLPANGANGWYQLAAGGSEFLGGPGFSGGSGGGGSGSNSGGQQDTDTGSGGGSSGNGGNPGSHQGGDTGNGSSTNGGGSGNGGNSGGNPSGNGGSGGGTSGDPGGSGGSGPSSPPNTPADGGGNGGGGPPVVIIDPPPGGPVDPPNGPVTPPPGGNGNTPGTTDVPEPASLLIALMGLAGLAAVRRRNRSH